MTTGWEADTSRDAWVRQITPTGGSSQLVCLPHAGGTAGFFRPLADALGPEIEVRAVQYPARQDRLGTIHPADLNAMADAIAGELFTDPPAALFGHSMGALLAYEITHRLETVGNRPVALFVSACRHPGTPPVVPGNDTELIDLVAMLGLTPREVLEDPEVAAMVLAALRADYTALRDYQRDTVVRIECPVVGLAGVGDPLVAPDEMASWRGWTRGDLVVHHFPGAHFYLAERWNQIADIVRTQMPLCGAP